MGNFLSLQTGAIDVAKGIVEKAIAEKLEIGALVSSNTFSIADFGCSVGPNTFASVRNIIEAVKFKCHNEDP